MTVPAFGLGTFRLKDQTVIDSVRNALEVGYRAIDTAQIYGNEAEVGQAIAESGVPRDQLFLTTKIWVDNYAADKLIPSLRDSLAKLRTDYVDLLLIHWPAPGNGVELREYMTALAEAKTLGLTRQIGVSNFNIELTRQAIEVVGAGEIATNQIELHPVFQQKELQVYDRENNIVTQPWSPLGNGNANLLSNADLKAIAEKYGKTVAQVILRWHLQEGFVVIPKSVTPSRIEENFNVFDFELTEDEMNVVRSLDTGKRLFFDPKDPEWEQKMLNSVADI